MTEPQLLLLPGLKACRKCALADGRLKVVPGYGPVPSKVMLVAQSPGYEENYKGRPLVGKAGLLLADIFKAIGKDLDRSCYRTNVNKCKPPDNRKCTPGEVNACVPWLEQEIRQVDPDVIVAVGDTSLKYFLPGESKTITQIRGNVYERVVAGRTRYIIPTIHPAYVLRNMTAMPDLRNDLRKAFIVAAEGAIISNTKPFRKEMAEWSEIIEALQASEIGFDLETDTGNGDDVYENDQGMRGARSIGVGVCAEEGNGLYYPFEDDNEADARLREIAPLVGDPDKLVIVSNAKFERHILHNYDSGLVNYEDTMLEAWIAGDFPLSLKDGFQRAFDLEMIRIKKFYDMGFKQKDRITGKYMVDMRAAQDHELEAVVEYAAQDPDASLRLHRHLKGLLEKRGMWGLYRMEVLFTDIILEMERNGFAYDPGAQVAVAAAFDEALKRSDAALREMLGYVPNANSPKDAVAALYHFPSPYRLVPEVDRSGEPQYPTDKTNLASKVSNPLVRHILTQRAIKKQKGTYLDALPRYRDKNGRIHAEFRQTGASTGRISSANPNITNIPSRKRDDIAETIDGSLIRKGFVAPHPDWVLCAIDLSQIEMRIAAHMSGDSEMIKYLTPKDGDIHGNTARQIYRKTPDDVTEAEWKSMRYLAKTIGFGSLYGLTPHGLLLRTPTLGLTMQEAADFIQGFYDAYPGLREMQLDIIRTTYQRGYAETIKGRRRYFPDIRANDRRLRSEAERGAINHPIQGSAADFFKLAILGVKEWLTINESKARMIAQIHDELVLEAPAEELPALIDALPPIMANAIPLSLPVYVDFEYGPSWGDVHDSEYWAKKSAVA